MTTYTAHQLLTLAAEILAASGENLALLETHRQYIDLRYRLVLRLREQTGVDHARCTRAMNSAMGIAINGPKKRGGKREGAGLKKGQTPHAAIAARLRKHAK